MEQCDTIVGMRELQYFENSISNRLLQRQEEEKKTRPQTDKLSGSILGSPLQDQILKMIGIPTKPFDAYTLAKFERGHQVEDWIIRNTDGLLTNEQIIEFALARGVEVTEKHEQAGVSYRDCTGHIDGVVDLDIWELPEIGIVPIEVKSITNMDWKRSFGTEARPIPPDAKWHHKLQAGMYAKALLCDYFVIIYVASDDFRRKALLYETRDISSDIDNIIDEVHAQLRRGELPSFSPRVDWQSNPMYQSFPDWAVLTGEEATERLKRDFPQQYENLQKMQEQYRKEV